MDSRRRCLATVELAALLAGLAALWVAAASQDARAHVGDRAYTIHALRDEELPDLHDGSLEDWLAVFPEPTLTGEDLSSTTPLAGSDSGSEIAVSVYLGWSASRNRIYAAIEYISEECGGQDDGERCADSVEFMVDGDHSGGRYYGFAALGDCDLTPGDAAADGQLDPWEADCLKELYHNNRQAQLYRAVAEPAGQVIYVDQSQWVRSPTYTDAGGFLEGGRCRTVVELMVTPYDSLDFRGAGYSLESGLAAGKIIGLQVTVPGLLDARAGCNVVPHNVGGEGMAPYSADKFADFLLVGPRERTAVAVGVWGCIKASFGPPR